MFRRIRHKIAHLFGWNRCEVWSAIIGKTLIIGFRCLTCGRLNRAYEINLRGVALRRGQKPEERR